MNATSSNEFLGRALIYVMRIVCFLIDNSMLAAI